MQRLISPTRFVLFILIIQTLIKALHYDFKHENEKQGLIYILLKTENEKTALKYFL
jgi:hypothetical protein